MVIHLFTVLLVQFVRLDLRYTTFGVLFLPHSFLGELRSVQAFFVWCVVISRPQGLSIFKDWVSKSGLVEQLEWSSTNLEGKSSESPFYEDEMGFEGVLADGHLAAVSPVSEFFIGSHQLRRSWYQSNDQGLKWHFQKGWRRQSVGFITPDPVGGGHVSASSLSGFSGFIFKVLPNVSFILRWRLVWFGWYWAILVVWFLLYSAPTTFLQQLIKRDFVNGGSMDKITPDSVNSVCWLSLYLAAARVVCLGSLGQSLFRVGARLPMYLDYAWACLNSVSGPWPIGRGNVDSHIKTDLFPLIKLYSKNITVYIVVFLAT